jgi:hypothetical protein
MLMCQAMGVGMGPIVAMFGALSFMPFHIRTGFGDSSMTYGGSFRDPYEGLGQSNGASPAGWIVVSSVLLTFVRNLCACTKGLSATVCHDGPLNM